MTAYPNNPTYFPPRINRYVPGMACDAYVGLDGVTRIHLGALTNGSATGLTSAIQMVNGAAVVQSYGATAGIIGGAGAPFGRNLQFVASSTNTRAVTIEAVDYLGQPFIETVTLTSAAIAFSRKAVFKLNRLTFASAADTTTVSVGTSNRFGVPYALCRALSEIVDGIMVPFNSSPVILSGQINQTDLLAPTALRFAAPIRGYITRISSVIQGAVTTGGTLTARYTTTGVTGAVITVANSATVGTSQSAVPTDPFSAVIGAVAQTSDINILPASFATAGAVNVSVELTQFGLIPQTKTQSLTSYDPRGLFEPNTTPNGVRIFELMAIVDTGADAGFHGTAHVLA